MTDEKQIDDTDVQQDSPAEAEAEVTDPDGQDEKDDTIGAAVIGQSGLAAGGSTVTGRP